MQSREVKKRQMDSKLLIFVINKLGGSTTVVRRGYSPAMLGGKYWLRRLCRSYAKSFVGAVTKDFYKWIYSACIANSDEPTLKLRSTAKQTL